MGDPITPLTVQQQADAQASTAHEDYIRRTLVALDIFNNVLAGGHEDETISSRMARWDKEPAGVRHNVGKLISEGLGLIQKDHGSQAEAGDLERAQEVIRIEVSTGNLPTTVERTTG